jgi:hypothetical protein
MTDTISFFFVKSMARALKKAVYSMIGGQKAIFDSPGQTMVLQGFNVIHQNWPVRSGNGYHFVFDDQIRLLDVNDF